MTKLAAAVVAMLLLSGCVARLQPAGPSIATPQVAPATFITTDGTALPLRVWGPADARTVIVALHGFGDYSQGFERAARAWDAAGIRTYAYDQRGFGQAPNPTIWAGTDTLIADAVAAVRAVHAAHPKAKLFLLGESMGGSVALLATVRTQSLPIDGLCLMAPAVWGERTMPWHYQLALELGRRFVPGWFLEPPKGLKIRASDNPDALRELRDDPLVQKGARVDTTAGLVDLMGAALDAAPRLARPTLVAYGAHEQIVPKKAADEFLELLPSRIQVAIYKDGWHLLLRDRQAATVWRDVVNWTQGSALPSGADGPAKVHIEPTAQY
ncbi:alpha/beta fold hydrolase [Roseiterribacter gracilis]|uniref:Alpha/beta hydrolase n=1 Tax=Roseiterribacter gracilis TaxID=2812848 RepID=A0A8S8XI93_9PROT|nr:alpha/beta hydrolase [Rhodospirillales bacterium TMPK1]